MKYSYYSKVCETACEITKHLSTCRMAQGTARRTILRQIQRGTNDFLTIPKAEAMFSLTEQIERIYSNKEKEGLYTNNVERMHPVSTAEYTEKADGEQVNPDSMRSPCTQS